MPRAIRRIALIVIALQLLLDQAAYACAAGEVEVTRIDYDAYMPMHVRAHAPWSEVERVFPHVDGVTERTVYLGPDLSVQIERGHTLRVHFSMPPTPAAGVHLRDQRGEPIIYFGYEPVPLILMRIETPHESIKYSSLRGRADRRVRTSPTTAHVMAEHIRGDLIDLDERQYAGVGCMAKRMPMMGPESESCVAQIAGRAVALYWQMGSDKGLQWYRANRVRSSVCVPAGDLRIPPGVAVRTRDVDEVEPEGGWSSPPD